MHQVDKATFLFIVFLAFVLYVGGFLCLNTTYLLHPTQWLDAVGTLLPKSGIIAVNSSQEVPFNISFEAAPQLLANQLFFPNPVS